MQIPQKLAFVLLVLISAFGCSSGTKWEPSAESLCRKYEDRLAITKNVQSKEDAKGVVSSYERWHSEYEALVDQFHETLRQYKGELDFPKYDTFRKRWAQLDLIVNEERSRLQKMHGIGPEYDRDVGTMTRTSFTNPFR